MAKKQKDKQPPSPPPPSPPVAASRSSSNTTTSSEGEDSPPPAISPVKKPSAGSSAVLQRKLSESSSKSIGDEEETSESGEGSTEEESSEDHAAVAAKADLQPQTRDSRTADAKQALSNPPSFSGSDDEEEDGEEVDSSSESEQQPLPPPLQEGANAERKKAEIPISGSESASEDESESSSDSHSTAPPPRISSRNTADPSLKPLNSKPMDSPVQPLNKILISKKRSVAPPAQIAEKKRKTADMAEFEGGQEKKEFPRKVWSNEDELALLQCMLNFKERHHAIPSSPVQLELLLKSVNNSLSSSLTLSQMNVKIRNMKKKYNYAMKRLNVNKPVQFKSGGSSVFNLSMKIWGPDKEEAVFPENDINPKKMNEKFKEEKKKAKHLVVEYPFLHWYTKNAHANDALVVQSHIPTSEAKVLDGRCKKLEMAEIQIHMQKSKLLPSALKLIEDALGKL